MHIHHGGSEGTSSRGGSLRRKQQKKAGDAGGAGGDDLDAEGFTITANNGDKPTTISVTHAVQNNLRKFVLAFII